MDLIQLIKQEVVPATGCTEPIAIAYASAKATEILEHEPDTIDVYLSGNVLKNAMGVGIPGTGMTGIFIAAALGAFGGESAKKLEVISSINTEKIEKAKIFVENKKVSLFKKDVEDKLFIEVICRYKESVSRVVVKKTHTNISLIEKDGKVIFKESGTDEFEAKSEPVHKDPDPLRLSVRDVYDFALNADFEDIEFILEGAQMNYKIAVEGLKNDYGLRVGKTLKKYVAEGILKDDLSTSAMSLTAAASDARMAGCPMSVMSNTGSGNQGITVMLPVYAVAKYKSLSDEKLARALIIGNLIAIHVKSYLGRLSALCGAVVAAAGASAGITYLLGGEYRNVVASLKNMVGNISGMICDGAKPGCALKVSTAVSAAIQSAILALDGIEISDNDGIIEKDIEKTLKNLARIGSEGMGETDCMILDIMSCK